MTEEVRPEEIVDPQFQSLLVAGSLLHAGRRHVVGPEGLGIGRAEDSDVLVADERASRRHARIYRRDDGEFVLEDLGSRHGTLLNGERLQGEGRPLQSGDTITVAGRAMRFLGGQATRMASREVPIVGTQIVALAGERLAIGRDPSNDVVLPDPNVSRFHAEVLVRDDVIELRDLGSRNGTRLNGSLVLRAMLEPGGQIGIGPYQLVFDGESFVARDDHGALRLDARDVSVRVREKQILAPTTLSVEPGEFVVIIGESGAGKSTLIKAIAGVNPPSGGEVTINGEPIATRLTDIGYVPQDEIVHGLLSVTEALRYAARLRLPEDAEPQEIQATIERVLEELTLKEQASTRIHSLSGGQRKRTGVATELLSRPSLLFLDEPTTGLDPSLETRMMLLLRKLASGGRAVVVVTHATKNLEQCDRLVVMGRGGHLAYQGPPGDALGFFGVDSYDDIYGALEREGPLEWNARFKALANGHGDAAAAPPEAAPAAARRRRRGRRVLPQAAVLASRYARLMVRDRRNMALLLGQVPVLAIAIVGLFHSGLLRRPEADPGSGLQMLFLLVTTVIWLGSIDAAREIIKEQSVFQRESAIGARLSAYLASKAIVLFGLAAVQSLLLAGIVLAFQPLHASTSAYLEVLGLLVLTSWVSVAMGLAVSALASSQDQATSFIPLVLIPQLLFAGSLVAVPAMREPVKTISQFVYSRWSFAGFGSAVDMNARIAENPAFARASRFGHDFFAVATGHVFGLLAAFLAFFFGCVTLLLRRRLRH
jgi:ABC transport system ATP-binding/permease protein